MRLWSFALATALTLPALAEPMVSRSVRGVLGAGAVYPSGYHAHGCQDALTLLGTSADDFAALPLNEKVRRLHALAALVETAPVRSTDVLRQITTRLAELATIDHGQLRPFGHELLVVLARLGTSLRDEPARPVEVYYGVRATIEKVVNLRHEDSQVTHALIAHALTVLAEMRVSRLRQVARFDDQIREAFEDLERLQREDALGDNAALRLRTSLVVLAHVIPAFDLYDPDERPRRAHELLERLDAVEEATRALVNRRVAPDDPRAALVLTSLETVLLKTTHEGLSKVRARLVGLKEMILNRPVGGGGGGAGLHR